MENLDNIFLQLGIINLVEELEDAAPRIYNGQRNPFELTERKFIKLYRVNKSTADELLDLVSNYTRPQGRASALDTKTILLTALNFFARGSYQADVGNSVYSAVSQSSVSRSIHHVIDILNAPEILNNYIKFARNISEIKAVQNRFWSKYHFPGVVGCIDCTHVAIFSPPKEDPVYPEHVYVNRKGYHSINTQLICDADLTIMHVNASTHDSYICNNCNVQPVLRELNNRNYNMFLLGDSGYALRPWMLTPILDAQSGKAEDYYNCIRSIIERVNGILKMRFRCLLNHRVLHYHPETATKLINACCVLHTMCVKNNVPEHEDDEENHDLGLYEPQGGHDEEQNERRSRVNPELVAGRRTQRRIISRLWADRHVANNF